MSTFIVAGSIAIISVVFLGLTAFITRGAHGGVSHNSGVFKTGNPTLGGGERHPE
jgi:hypothetical protein